MEAEWNGNVYRVVVEALVEANSEEEAQVITGNLLSGRNQEEPPGRDLPLTGVRSWAPERKEVRLVVADDGPWALG